MMELWIVWIAGGYLIGGLLFLSSRWESIWGWYLARLSPCGAARKVKFWAIVVFACVFWPLSLLARLFVKFFVRRKPLPNYGFETPSIPEADVFHREDFDRMLCFECGQKPEEHTLILKSICHSRSPMNVVYNNGRIYFNCRECFKVIAVVQVASRPPAESPAKEADANV